MFDKKEAYKNQVAPLAEKLKKICYDNQMPFFLAVADADGEKKTEYKISIYSPLSSGIDLRQDYISEFVKIAGGGFTAQPANGWKNAFRQEEEELFDNEDVEELPINDD